MYTDEFLTKDFCYCILLIIYYVGSVLVAILFNFFWIWFRFLGRINFPNIIFSLNLVDRPTESLGIP